MIGEIGIWPVLSRVAPGSRKMLKKSVGAECRPRTRVKQPVLALYTRALHTRQRDILLFHSSLLAFLLPQSRSPDAREGNFKLPFPSRDRRYLAGRTEKQFLSDSAVLGNSIINNEYKSSCTRGNNDR